MDENDPQFDDPKLRAAVKRAIGAEAAPPELRQRILNALALEGRRNSMRTLRQWLAMAAVLAIGFGLAWWYTAPYREQPAPRWFAVDMISAHDHQDGLPNPPVSQPLTADETDRLRKELANRLGHPALVAALGDGWKFNGAGVCTIRNIPAAHLMFTRDDGATISVFSVSARAMYQSNASDGTTYAQTEDDHKIAGFKYHDAIHCIVGTSKSGSLSLREVIRLRDRLRAAGVGI